MILHVAVGEDGGLAVQADGVLAPEVVIVAELVLAAVRLVAEALVHEGGFGAELPAAHES